MHSSVCDIVSSSPDHFAGAGASVADAAVILWLLLWACVSCSLALASVLHSSAQ
jgi:hypothetical protein